MNEPCFNFTSTYGTTIMERDLRSWLRHFDNRGIAAAIVQVKDKPKKYTLWRIGVPVCTPNDDAVNPFLGVVVEECHDFAARTGKTLVGEEE